jgi:aminoglycoside phosphotransferase (APT) family kinase protein
MQEQIRTYLQTKLPEAEDLTVTHLYRIPGGQSRETWSVDAAWRENGTGMTRGFIFRRDPDASLLVNDRSLEYRVMQAMYGSVPVPKMLWLEEDGANLGRPFFVMDRIDGCQSGPTEVLIGQMQHRAKLAKQFAEILAGIHAVDWQAADLGFLGVPESPSSCGEKEVTFWEEIIERDAMEPQPVIRAAIEWMRRNPPEPAQRIVLVHADYRTGNFLSDDDGEIKGILDWEMAHLGDPLEDVAWACCRPWRWLGTEDVGGLMSRADFYRMYEEASGMKVDDDSVRFWEVLANVKLAAIFLTGVRSYCDGRTRSPMMAFLGRSVNRLELEMMDLMGV